MGEPAEDLHDEQVEVWNRRYTEARRSGLEHMDAIRFAKSAADVGELRRLVKAGCAPRLIARIVL
jgi:hypothetical protein